MEEKKWHGEERRSSLGSGAAPPAGDSSPNAATANAKPADPFADDAETIRRLQVATPGTIFTAIGGVLLSHHQRLEQLERQPRSDLEKHKHLFTPPPAGKLRRFFAACWAIARSARKIFTS